MERATPCEKNNSNMKIVRATRKKLTIIKRSVIPIKKKKR
jgi:hypothetical protein